MTRSDIVGRWRLASYEAASKDDVIYPMGRSAIGVLDYSADGKVSADFDFADGAAQMAGTATKKAS